MNTGYLYKADLSLKTTFEKEAEKYDAARPGYQDELFEKLIEIVKLDKNSHLLEIGTGTGQATKSLAKMGFQITGIELGPKLADLARKSLNSYPHVEIINSSFEEADLRPNTFDLIFCANAFHWIQPEFRYSKTHSLLKNNGHLALIWGCRLSTEAADKFYHASNEINSKYRVFQK